MKHKRSLCHEFKEDGLCDGQPADDCDIMKLAVFETFLTDQLTKLDNAQIQIKMPFFATILGECGVR